MEELKVVAGNMAAVMQDITFDIEKLDNKAAKARIRKNTIRLERLGKEFRKLSVK